LADFQDRNKTGIGKGFLLQTWKGQRSAILLPQQAASFRPGCYYN
jgi:hypothetical protein